MNKSFFIKSATCILFFGFCLYSYLDLQNGITELRIRIPHLASEVRRIEEENTHLFFEIEAFEAPENLLRLAQQRAFTHLKFPMCQEVLTLKQADPLGEIGSRSIPELSTKPTITFATSANP